MFLKENTIDEIQISEDGRGVSAMSQMLTLTRIHTAVHAAGAMRR